MVSQVDDQDYDELIKHKWNCNRDVRSGNYYVTKSVKVFLPDGSYVSRKFGLPQFLLGVPEKGIQIDHKNGITTDNQRHNLRLCTQSENLCNRAKFKGKSSVYKGVTISKKGVIRGQIRAGNVNHHLGAFKTEIEAAKAYNDAALKFFGEFASLNTF